MTERAPRLGPEWVVEEMPPGYRNRVAEIERLMADLDEMGQFARLLCLVGPELGDAARAVFAGLKLQTEPLPAPASSGIAVRLDAKRRLLLHPSAATTTIEKKSPELAHVFRLLHEVAESSDRVVLVTNVDPETRPANRPDAITPEALAFLVRMGAIHLTAPTLFALWKLSLLEPDRARAQVDRLHAFDAGTFELPATVLL